MSNRIDSGSFETLPVSLQVDPVSALAVLPDVQRRTGLANLNALLHARVASRRSGACHSLSSLALVGALTVVETSRSL